MWKEVVDVKRVFKELSTITKRDLGSINCEIAATTREIAVACSACSAKILNASNLDVSLKKLYEKQRRLLISSLLFPYRLFKANNMNEKLLNISRKFHYLRNNTKQQDKKLSSAIKNYIN